MDVLWGGDLYGRAAARPAIALAMADDGEAVRVLERHLGRMSLSGGPSYVIDLPLSEGPAPSTLEIHTSRATPAPALAAARPEAWWEPREWDDLLAGRFGPWAIGMAAGRVVSLCHTPVASATAAEAGVWTHPDDRGRGYASLLTAAWASVAGGQFKTLFYSTAAGNAASQSVARKLELRPIGCIWQLEPET